jgi:hypothetical protein
MVTDKERIFALTLACNSAMRLIEKYLKIMTCLSLLIDTRKEIISAKNAMLQIRDACERK